MAVKEKVEEVEEGEEGGLLEERGSLSKRCQEALTLEWNLVPYKIQYFFLMGVEGVDRVFNKLLLKDSGMSATQIGIIFGIVPFLSCFINVAISPLANKYRLDKAVLLLSILGTLLASLAVAFIPLPSVITNCTLLPTNTSVLGMQTLAELGWLYEEADTVFTFYVLLVFFLALGTFKSLARTFTDVALVSHLGKSGMSKYARQGCFGTTGCVLLELGTGAIVDTTVYQLMVCDLQLTLSDYQVAYYIVGAGLAVCFFTSFTFSFGKEKEECLTTDRTQSLPPPHKSQPSDNEGDSSTSTFKGRNQRNDEFALRKIVGMLSSVHYVSWIVCIFYSSVSVGAASYSYLYLDVLGADALLQGVVGGVTSASGFITFLCAAWMVQKLGTINSLSVCLLGQAVRFGILAVIVDPWLGLLAALLEGSTFSLAWVAIVQHISDGFPQGYITTVMGLAHGIFYGLGLGVGQLVGGTVLDAVGARYMFAVFAAVTLVFTALFALVQKLSTPPALDDSESELQRLRSEIDAADKAYDTID